MSYNKETGMYEGYIYKIWNDVNDKLYIGQTTTTIAHRWGQHKSANNAEKLKSVLYKAMEKYGRDKFHIVEIEKHQTKEKDILINILNEREMYYINKDNTMNPDGYNMTYGGFNHSNSTKIPIDVYDSNGNLIQTCESIIDASVLYNYDQKSIVTCCEGKIVPKNGYIFRYHGESYDKFRTTSLIGWNKVHVYQFDTESGKMVGEYESLVEAAQKTGVNDTNILRGLNRNDCTAGGYYWSTKNEFDYVYKTSWFVPEPKRIPVCAYDFDGNLCYEFDSQLEAANFFGDSSVSRIHDCCEGKVMYSHSYVWRYKNDPFDKFPVNIVKSKRSPNGYISVNHCKPVDCYDVYGNYITSFGSATNASDFCGGGSISNIDHCGKGKTLTVNSFVFRDAGHSFNEYKVKYTWKDELRKIDIYDQNGTFIKTIDNIIELVNDKFIKKSEVSKIFAICNNTAKYDHIKKRTFRWHGDSFENPGSIDTYPHPNYEQLFKDNPDATRDDVINLLNQSLDNVGIYASNNKLLIAQTNISGSAERTRNIVDDNV